MRQPAPAKAAGKPVKAPGSRKPVRQTSDADVGTAEIVEAELLGLHGSASFYSQSFHGRPTSTGERYDSRGFTAASNRFPLGSWVAVRRLDNERCAVVRINDRMHGRLRKRIIDVSRGVAEYLDMIRAGVVLVRVTPLKERRYADPSCQAAFTAPEAPEPDHSAWRGGSNLLPGGSFDAMQ